MLANNFDGTDIKVVGVGGAGGNAVEHMIASGVTGVEFIVANTDAQALARSTAPRKIQLGRSGLGAGARPEKGQEAAMSQRAEIRAALEGANMVFITAGMGGGTGTGAAPIVAEISRELGILTVGVVTKPFSFEGAKRLRAADTGIAELADNVDSLIIILNDKLMDVMGDDAEVVDCFVAADNVLRNAVGGIAEIITYPGLVNVDFEDVRTVMSAMGRAMMGSATAAGEGRARIAAESAVASPLLEGVNLAGARGVLVNVTASRAGFRMREVHEVMGVVQAFAHEEAHIIFGAVFDDEMGDALRVTVVATGLEDPSAGGKAAPAPDARPVAVNPSPVFVAPGRSHADVEPRAQPGPAVIRRRGEAGPAMQPGRVEPSRAEPLVARRSPAEAMAEQGISGYDIPAFLRKSGTLRA